MANNFDYKCDVNFLRSGIEEVNSGQTLRRFTPYKGVQCATIKVEDVKSISGENVDVTSTLTIALGGERGASITITGSYKDIKEKYDLVVSKLEDMQT